MYPDPDPTVTPVEIYPGRPGRAWLTFKLEVPQGKTVKMAAAALMPVDTQGVAILHVTDVKFAESQGES